MCPVFAYSSDINTCYGEMPVYVKSPAEDLALGKAQMWELSGNPMHTKMEAIQVLNNPSVLNTIEDKSLREAQLTIYKGFSRFGDAKPAELHGYVDAALKLSKNCGDAYLLFLQCLSIVTF